MPTPSQTAAVSQCVSHVSYHYPSSEVHQTELSFPARPNTLHFKSKITPEGEDGNQKLEPLRSVPDSLLSVTPAVCWNVFLRNVALSSWNARMITRRLFATARSFRPSWQNLKELVREPMKTPTSWFLFIYAVNKTVSIPFHLREGFWNSVFVRLLKMVVWGK